MNDSLNKNKLFEEERILFGEYLTKHNLKLTRQRDTILTEFLNTEQHLSAEELLSLVRSKQNNDINIGLSTIYRTMKILCECGLAIERAFGDGQSRFEHLFKHSHHDHMICTSCGSITEFENNKIEKLQDSVAQNFNFKVSSHKMELFGICGKCQNKK